ncbi:MAG TPA: hypothetical protein VNF47_23915 [Streptosporangiaceae bacterium]|nr:hypothetical protein [Streptosporangiaceae bacterium]
MSAPRPHSTADLALAPVLIGIERNLARLRASGDLQYSLALDLNDDDGWYHGPEERALRVCRSALRDVDSHGWQVSPTADRCGLLVSHGEYRVSLMLGRELTEYIEHEAPDRVAVG